MSGQTDKNGLTVKMKNEKIRKKQGTWVQFNKGARKRKKNVIGQKKPVKQRNKGKKKD